jgi:hypothetical protein
LKENKQCLNCQKGKVIAINGDILCPENGPVSPTFICSRHMMSEHASISSKLEFKCINCENFIIDLDNTAENCAIGLCRMFSVRKFDGRQKKACSKFEKKRRRHSMEKTACTY